MYAYSANDSDFVLPVLVPPAGDVGARVGVSLGSKGEGLPGLSFWILEGAKVEPLAAGAIDGFRDVAEA